MYPPEKTAIIKFLRRLESRPTKQIDPIGDRENLPRIFENAEEEGFLIQYYQSPFAVVIGSDGEDTLKVARKMDPRKGKSTQGHDIIKALRKAIQYPEPGIAPTMSVTLHLDTGYGLLPYNFEV